MGLTEEEIIAVKADATDLKYEKEFFDAVVSTDSYNYFGRDVGYLDSKDNAICVIQTTKVYVIPFNEVTEEQAFKEGEGDKSLAYWREVHEKFFTECMEEAGLKFSSDMKVVCEEFVVVYKA